MNRRLLFASACLAAWCGASAQAAPDSSQPLHTNKTKFRIPYRYDATEMQRLGAQEIRLYVSTDRGGRWRHAETVAPVAGRFDFAAPADGEYWFAVRTLDGRGTLQPPGEVIEPGLKVVVDTRPPSLQVSVRETEPGKVELSWRASDANLDPSTLRLEYVQPGVDEWQLVSVRPQAEGRTSWNVGQGGIVGVRGSISDLAANNGEAEERVRVQAVSRPTPRPSIPDFRQPIADAERHQMPEQFPGNQVPEIRPRPRTGFVADYPANRPGVLQPRYPRSGAYEAARPVTDDATDSFSDSPATEHIAGNGSSESGRNQSGQKLVRTRKFRVGYQIDDVGASGVSSVEFYITQDGGRKWWKYGDDPDRKSPFTIEVPDDGVYGFALRVRSGVGLADEPPQPGDVAPIIIAVDATPPKAELMPIRQGQGPAVDKLYIQWRLQDENPAERPVALYYAGSRNGPWEPITDWKADDGGFEWTVSQSMPEQLYVRLIARDAAGNTTQVETPEPIAIDLSRPTGRIVDVESLDTEVQR